MRGGRGPTLNIVKTLANHPALFALWGPFARYLAWQGLLPARVREIVVLRMGWRTAAIYEFGHHAVFGRRAGLTDDEIRAATGDPGRWPGTEEERDLLVMVDDLVDHDEVSAATWERLARCWGTEELIELLMLAGFYRAIAMFLRSVGVEPEEGLPGWPEGVLPPS
jgi:4-carboxymuconolactone decarboxylase